MNKKLDKKIAIVTGGARGLGKGIVKSLLLNGSKVLIFDSNKKFFQSNFSKSPILFNLPLKPTESL